MKKYLYSALVMALFAIGFAASDEESPNNSDSENSDPQTELKDENEKGRTQTKESETKQAPPKSREDEIRELGYRDGVIWGKEDKGQYLVEYIQMGLPMSSALERVKLVARMGYKENYGTDISDELLEEFAEQFMEGYKSVVVKE